MIDKKSITLACVSTNQPKQAMFVLDHCLDIFPFFDKVKLLSNYYGVENDINVEKVDVHSFESYNKFIVEKLSDHIDTDYVLIIQTDGFILNPHLWQNKFLQYDYIGAPWFWHNTCGNGGFSLRSKKFLEASSRLKYIPKHPKYQCCPEDNFLCLPSFNREFMEANGIKFADIKTALDFSFEHPMDFYPKHTIKHSFGFHGKHNMWHSHFKL
jgi:hypothetical protein